MSNAIQIGDIEILLATTALQRLSRNQQISERSAYGRPPIQGDFKNLILDYLANLLRLSEIENGAKETEMRLRVALHFSCPDAVDYDHKRPEPRWALIKKYIEECFTFEPNETERISRLVATVLDEWDVKRVHGLATRRSKLLERQNHRCASCHIDFLSKARVNEEELESLEGTSDAFKPYFDGNGVADAMRPEVDHISVVSRDGTNLSDNLQILCGLCNQGKSDGTGVRTSRELEYCHQPIAEIPRGHRMALLYYRLKLDRFICTNCESTSNELTIRMEREKGLVILTNLRSICYRCLNYSAQQ